MMPTPFALVQRVLYSATLVFVVAMSSIGAGTAEGQALTHLWSSSFGSSSSEVGRAVAEDGSGGVVVTGRFRGTVDFGGGDLVSAGLGDVFVAKYDADGTHVWSLRFGSTLDDDGYGVAVDGLGNVLVIGFFRGTVDFGGGDLVSAGGSDVFVAKYDPNGTHVWSRRFGSTLDDVGYGVATDGIDNVLFVGTFQGAVDFGGGNLTSAGGTDIFLVKYGSTGVHHWSQRFGDTSDDTAEALAVDGSNWTAVTGGFRGTVDFGGGNVTSSATQDIFLAKYDAAGGHRWSANFGTVGATNRGSGVAADDFGNVVVTGRFGGTVDFGGGPLTGAGNDDVFLAKYDAAGAHQWSQRFGSAAQDRGFAVGLDTSGNVLLTGEFFDTIDFGGVSLVTNGVADVFLAKFDATGAHDWSAAFGDVSQDTGWDIAPDGAGGAFATGSFRGTMDFGGGDLVSDGDADVFLARFEAATFEPTITSIADVGNDQGRRVKIRFDRSGQDDATAAMPIVQYEAYLRDDPLPAASLLASDWIFMGSVPAHEESEYLMIAPTLADSTISNGQHFSIFFVRAATSDPGVFYDSQPDSGYSLDNLAPGAPGSFALDGGDLSWDESSAADFDYFTVYGSATESFGSATVIDHTIDTSMDVSGSPHAYYFVTATDFSGNEGVPASLNATTDVGDVPGLYVLSVSAYPNPFNPRTTVRYTVPRDGPVAVRIYDARGALVSTLVERMRPAGAYTVAWNGKDGAGRGVGSGEYVARITGGGETRSYKVVLLK